MRDYHLIFCSVVLIGLGIAGAYHFHDGHMLARSGALICGTAALFVVLQAKHERELSNRESEVKFEKIDFNRSRSKSILVPLRLRVRVNEAIIRKQIAEIEGRRARFIIIVAVVTFIGELIHGFGDLIYNNILEFGPDTRSSMLNILAKIARLIY